MSPHTHSTSPARVAGRRATRHLGLTTSFAAAVGLALTGLPQAVAQPVPATKQTICLGGGPVSHAPGSASTISMRSLYESDARYRITVFRQPGRTTCPSDPRYEWPAGSQQILFGATDIHVPRWDHVVGIPAGDPGEWTVCGYVVQKWPPPLATSEQFVIGATHITRTDSKAARTKAVRRRACAPNPRPGDGNLSTTVGARSACERARSVAAAWTSTFRRQNLNPRFPLALVDRSGDGVQPHGDARAHHQLLQRRGAVGRGMANCTERVVNRTGVGMEITCGVVRFRAAV